MFRPISLSRTARVSHVFCENDFYVELTSFTVTCQVEWCRRHVSCWLSKRAILQFIFRVGRQTCTVSAMKVNAWICATATDRDLESASSKRVNLRPLGCVWLFMVVCFFVCGVFVGVVLFVMLCCVYGESVCVCVCVCLCVSVFVVLCRSCLCVCCCVLYVTVLSALCSLCVWFVLSKCCECFVCVCVACARSLCMVLCSCLCGMCTVCVCGVLMAWCVQVKRMMRGIGNILFSTYSQTLNA